MNKTISLFLSTLFHCDDAELDPVFDNVYCEYESRGDYGTNWVFDLLESDASGACLNEFWSPRGGVAEEDQNETVTDTVSVLFSNGVCDKRAKLDRFINESRWWHTGKHRKTSVWLYHEVEGCGMVRYLVHSIRVQSEDAVSYSPHVTKATISIERHHVAESVDMIESLVNPLGEYVCCTDLGTNSTFGILPYVPTIVNGQEAVSTARGRICEVAWHDCNVSDFGNSVPDPLPNEGLRGIRTIYMGIKEDIGYGNSDFEPLLCSKYAEHNPAMIPTTSSDSRFSCGQHPTRYMQFATLPAYVPLTPVATFWLGSQYANSNLNHWRGEYILLAGIMSNNTEATYFVSADYGVYKGALYPDTYEADSYGKNGWIPTNITQYKKFSGASYEPKIFELGVISIPQGGDARSFGEAQSCDLRDFSIRIHIGRESGAVGSWPAIDFLYLIPYESYAIARFNGFSYTPLLTQNANLWSRVIKFGSLEDDTPYIRAFGAGQSNIWELDYNLYMPTFVGDKPIVVTMTTAWVLDETNTEHVYDDWYNTLNWFGGPRESWQHRIRMRWYPRWLSYRNGGGCV